MRQAKPTEADSEAVLREQAARIATIEAENAALRDENTRLREELAKSQATDAEAAKAEAVALFRSKLQAALKEIEGL